VRPIQSNRDFFYEKTRALERRCTVSQEGALSPIFVGNTPRKNSTPKSGANWRHNWNPVKDLGFMGVQNFPTVGLIDGVFRQNIEETGMSYQKEVDMFALVHKMGLLTKPYVFSLEDAVKMMAAGADVVVAHMGLKTSGSIGASTSLSLDQCVIKIQAIVDAAESVNPDILVLLHGGPILQPKDAQYI
jgi:predicted TIM-barrel enzyme